MNEFDILFEKIKKDIEARISNDMNATEVYIPNWAPISLEEGYRWIRNTIYEGFELKYDISTKDNKNIIKFLYWEDDDDEPDFDD